VKEALGGESGSVRGSVQDGESCRLE
jgi:hypothetical protein